MYWTRRCIKFGWPLVVLLFLVSVTLAVFWRLAREVWTQQTFSFDLTVIESVASVASPTWTAFMRAVTWSGSTYAVAAVLLAVWALWWKQRQADVLALWVGVIGSILLNELLKALFTRPRPSLLDPLTSAIGWSFPSGHSTVALALFGLLAYLVARDVAPLRRVLLYAFACAGALLVGLSRVYLGVHYPSDVLAAWAVTFPWLLAVIAVHRCLTRGPTSFTPA